MIINYQGIGSGGGKKGIADKTIDFAGSDSLLKQAEYDANPTLQMFPTLAGAIVPIFNIKEVTGTLVLNGQTLADIYLAQITKWNDPAIVQLNPGANLPDQPISAVHRSDGSGTTEIFTKFLAAVSEEWQNGPKAGSAIEWPVDKAGNGIGGKGNPGVAAAVQNTPYSIGYVELSYAVANKIAYAEMINKAGQQVKADAESLASAMADFGDAFDARLTVSSISNGGSAKSWPIAGYTYMIVYMDMAPDATYGCLKPQKFLDFVYWALTDAGAAQRAADLGYATLPDSVRAKVFDTLAKVVGNLRYKPIFRIDYDRILVHSNTQAGHPRRAAAARQGSPARRPAVERHPGRHGPRLAGAGGGHRLVDLARVGRVAGCFRGQLHRTHH